MSVRLLGELCHEPNKLKLSLNTHSGQMICLENKGPVFDDSAL